MTNKAQKGGDSKRATRAAVPDDEDKATGFYTPFSSGAAQGSQCAHTAPSAKQSELPQIWNGEKNIWQAAAQGDVTALQSFLVGGLDVNEGDSEGYTPLYYATREGRNAAVEFLLNNGAEVNATDIYGSTPLMAATVGGHVDIVKLLLARGANVKTKSGALTNPPEDTAMWIATRKGRVDIIDLLKEVGTQP